jgi:hypothetical protein
MSHGFDESRCAMLGEVTGRWWDGTLDRPLISAALDGVDPGREPPKLRDTPGTSYRFPQPLTFPNHPRECVRTSSKPTCITICIAHLEIA